MTIIISFISLASQLLKKYESVKSAPNLVKVTAGFITGILGILIMIFSLHVGENTIVDFRNIIISLAAIHGGVIPVAICSVMLAGFRIAYFGINQSSIFGVILIMIFSLGSLIVSNLKINTRKKWMYSTLVSLFFLSIVLVILLRGKVNLVNLFLVYWITSGLVTLIVSRYSEYCLKSNELFRKLQMESTKDFLTGLNNVRNFDNLFNFAINNAIEKKEYLSLLMIDIDFFKKVNDTYGHAEGDIVLKELGKILSKNARGFDIVSRNGGEEFTVLLLDCPTNHALQIAERIRKSVEAHSFILSNGTQISVTVSVGVASYPQISGDAERLLERADVALYAAKRTGRNRVCSNELCVNVLDEAN
jgi:diguanylate cyclase